MTPPCTHQQLPEAEALLRAGYVRRPDICHKVHLCTYAGRILDVRIKVGLPPVAIARLAGLPNGVVGLWWDAAVLDALATGKTEAGPAWEFPRSLAWLATAQDAVGDAIAKVGLGNAEKECGRLAASRAIGDRR